MLYIRDLAWIRVSRFTKQTVSVTAAGISSRACWNWIFKKVGQAWRVAYFHSHAGSLDVDELTILEVFASDEITVQLQNVLLHPLYRPSRLESCTLHSDNHWRWATSRSGVPVLTPALRAWTEPTRERATTDSCLQADSWNQNWSRTRSVNRWKNGGPVPTCGMDGLLRFSTCTN